MKSALVEWKGILYLGGHDVVTNWNDTYTGQIRKIVGKQKLIIPSIRAIIQNEDGEVLFIRRRGNGSWAMPAGAIELNESILGCLCREVNEETGLVVSKATLIATYTEPRFTVKNEYGDEYQGFELLFRVDEWSGSLVHVTDETTEACFYSFDKLPILQEGYWGAHHKEVIEDYLNYQGVPLIK
jgi:8-oxo-dGTP pyrophosphatase MutT (NUDIX family)